MIRWFQRGKSKKIEKKCQYWSVGPIQRRGYYNQREFKRNSAPFKMRDLF